MAKPIPTRFSVLPENEAAALAHLEARGYSPTSIETDESGLIVSIFEPLADDKMIGLVEALPIHLSAKIGIVLGVQSPLTPRLDA